MLLHDSVVWTIIPHDTTLCMYLRFLWREIKGVAAHIFLTLRNDNVYHGNRKIYHWWEEKETGGFLTKKNHAAKQRRTPSTEQVRVGRYWLQAKANERPQVSKCKHIWGDSGRESLGLEKARGGQIKTGWHYSPPVGGSRKHDERDRWVQQYVDRAKRKTMTVAVRTFIIAVQPWLELSLQVRGRPRCHWPWRQARFPPYCVSSRGPRSLSRPPQRLHRPQ